MKFIHGDGEYSVVIRRCGLTLTPLYAKAMFTRDFWKVISATEEDLFWMHFHKDTKVWYWGVWTLIVKEKP